MKHTDVVKIFMVGFESVPKGRMFIYPDNGVWEKNLNLFLKTSGPDENPNAVQVSGKKIGEHKCFKRGVDVVLIGD